MNRRILLATTFHAGAVMALALPAQAQPAPNARPTGGSVVAGSATISQSPATTTIDQTSQRAAINWQSFNIGSQQTVQFDQPSSSSVALNRVVGPNPSEIAGRIDANGQIVITNQSGVVFYKGSQVNSAGLMVSAAGIGNANFMAGRMVFDQAARPNAAVTNAGSITVRQAGLAALVAPQVANSGVITARLGNVVLAGARTATLDLYGDGLMSIDVTGQVLHAPNGATALVTNTGLIRADGGTVQLTAQAADGVVQTLVDAGGKVRADTVGDRTGTVVLAGVGGSVTVAGQLSAIGSAPGTVGGSIAVEASGTVRLAPTARIDASGQAGGGVVAIGTTLARAKGGPSVASTRTAASVIMAKGATIAANATTKGNGGRVAVLSRGNTAFNGAISAKGGPQGGNGGMVETSGNTLQLGLSASVDTSAPLGHTGDWLLDPTNWVIANSGGDETPGQVITALGTSDVTILADNDITVSSAIDATTSPYATSSLFLEAGRNVAIDANITMNGGFFSATANDSADLGTALADRSPGTGSVTMGQGVAINTSVGNEGIEIDVIAAATNTGGGGAFLPGTITLGALTSGTGQIFAGDGTGLTVNGAINGGLLTLRSAGTGGVVLDAPITGTRVLLEDSGGGGVTQDGGGAITANSLGIISTGSVALEAANAVITLAGTVAKSGAGFAFRDGDTALTVGIVNIGNEDRELDIIGITTNDGRIALATTTAGNVTVNTPISSTGGEIDIAVAPGFGFTNNTAFPNTNLETVGTIVSGNGNIAILADTMTFTPASTIEAGSGTLLLGPATLTENIALGAPSSAGVLGLQGTDLATMSAGALQVGYRAVNGTASLTGSITIGGTADFAPAFSTVLLVTGGAVTQSQPISFGPTGGALGVIAGGNVTLGAANAVGTLAGYADNDGSFAFTNNRALTAGTMTVAQLGVGLDANGVAGTAPMLGGAGNPLSGVTAVGGGSVALTTTNGALTLAANVAANGETVTLTAAAAIDQTGGAITAGTLTGSSIGGATLEQANAVGTLGPFSDTGAGNATGLDFIDSQALQIAGLVSSTGPLTLTTTNGGLTLGGNVTAIGEAVTLASAGPIDQTGGIITAALLTGGSNGGATLNDANAVPILGPFSDIGTGNATGLSFTDNQALQTAGQVSSTGPLALTTTKGGLTLGGNLTADGQTVTLTSAATIIQQGGTIFAGMLTGSSIGGATLTNDNAVGTLGPFSDTGTGNATGLSFTDGEALATAGLVSSTGPITLTTTFGGITFGGDVTADGQTVTLNAAGTIGQTNGVITAAILTGNSIGGATLTDTNAVGTFGPFSDTGTGNTTGLSFTDGQALQTAGLVSSTGPLTLTTTQGGLTLGGNVTADGQTVTLASAATIAQAAGVITAGTLGGSAVGGVTLDRDNAVGTLGPFSDTGTGNATGLSFTDGQALQTAGLVSSTGPITLTTTVGGITFGGGVTANGQTVTLNSAGAVGQTSSVITAATLTGSSIGGATLDDGNAVGTLGPFTDTGAGNAAGLSFTDAQALQTAGVLSSTGPLALTTTAGGLTLGGALTANGQTVTLTSAGPISQQAGIITAATLTGGSVGGATLNDANAVPTLGPFSDTGSGNVTGLSFTDAQALQTAGQASSTGPLALTTTKGGLTLGGNLTADGQTVTLTSAATIIQQGGTIFAGTLTGSSIGGATLTNENAVGTLGPFSDTGTGNATGLSFTDGEALATAGLVSSTGPITLTTTFGGITFGDDVAATGQTVTLNAAGAIGQTNGVITAAILTGNSIGGATLTDTNAVGTFGPFSDTGTGNTTGLSFTDGQALQTAGLVSSTGPLTLTTTQGGLTLGGNVTADGQTVTLASAATIAQAAGVITAGTLGGSAVGGVTLDRDNAVGTLGPFSDTGTGNATGLSFTDGQALQTAGLVSSTGPITLTTTVGGITFGGDVTANGQTVTLNSAGAVGQTGGVITAATLTGSSIGGATLDDGNAVGTLGPFTDTGAGNAAGLSFTDAQALQTTGVLSSTGPLALTTTAGGLTLGGALTSNGQTVTLTSAGPISQQAGIITAATLTGGSVGGATLDGTNAVGTLGPFSDTGAGNATGLSFTDGQALQTAGLVSSTGPLRLTTTTGGITFGGNVTASGQTITLTSAGAIAQADGVITAGSLTGSSAGNTTLNDANAIGTLGAFTVNGETLVLNNGAPLTIDGPVSAPFLTISAVGQMTLAGNITTTGAPLSQQSGAQPAPAGSTLQVIASTSGQGASFVQTGTSVLTGGAATTLRIQLPATGGSATFNNLAGPGSHLVLALGNGTATGTMDIGSLLVIGSGGSATLRGSINSVTTEAAAALGDINPATNPVYTFNDCEIGAISCTLVGFPGGIQSVLGGLYWFLPGQALPPLLPLPTLSLLVLENPPLLSGELAPQDVVPPNISFEDY